jgi:hypothetical protein
MSDLRRPRLGRGTVAGEKSHRPRPESPLLLGENQGEKLLYDTAQAKTSSLINQLGARCPVKSCREQGGFDDLLTKAFVTANTRQRLLIRRQ